MHFDYVEEEGLTIMFMKINLETVDIAPTRPDYLPLMGVH
jgi:hypothetical protein